MSKQFLEYKELDKYFLIKSNNPKLKWQEYENEFPHFNVGDSFARMVAEDANKNLRLYLVLTPFHFYEQDEVLWKESLIYDDAINGKKDFLPLNDVLRAMFETNETSNQIKFSYYNNQYNIGFGVPTKNKKEDAPLFYELPINISSFEVNDQKRMPVEELVKAVKTSGIHELKNFYEALLHNRVVQKSKAELLWFKQKAIIFFLENKQTNFNFMLPNKLMERYENTLEIIQENVLHLDQYLLTETKEKLAKIESEKIKKLVVDKMLNRLNIEKKKEFEKIDEKNTTTPYKVKKQMLDAYKNYGKDLAYEIYKTEENFVAFMEDGDDLFNQWQLAINSFELLNSELKKEKERQTELNNYENNMFKQNNKEDKIEL